MHILTKQRIESILPSIDLIPVMEQAFTAYSRGLATVPPVGELSFKNPPGDVHIKYGYLHGGQHFIVKVASGFYDNPKLGLPSSNGVMLLFRQDNGTLESILLDEGMLTDFRTAAAGAVCAKYLAPREVTRIGIIGAGIQARLQLAHLPSVTPCRSAMVWARNKASAHAYVDSVSSVIEGIEIAIAESPAEIAAQCNLIVTATPSESPLLFEKDIRPGTHITAVGSDTATKQELDAAILSRAGLVIADSKAQCRERGEIHHALGAQRIEEAKVQELGDIIDGASPGRSAEDQITVADLTGVAVQDMLIAEAVYNASRDAESKG